MRLATHESEGVRELALNVLRPHHKPISNLPPLPRHHVRDDDVRLRGLPRQRGRRSLPLPFDNAHSTRRHSSYVHILAIHNSIYRDTGFKVPMQDIWAKLGRMYDLDVLEHGVSLSLAPFSTGSGVLWTWLMHSFLNFPPYHHPHVLLWDFLCLRVRRSSPAMIPTPAPTPHLRTRTLRCIQASRKSLTHPLTTNPSNHTSRLDAFDPPPALQRQPHHPRQPPPSPSARQTQA